MSLAYKLKKPLVLDFLDYGTPARRREMCAAEVRLNRRLAPDVYLGVRGVAPIADGVELTDEDDPRAIDFVVEMRRYDEAQTLAARLERGELLRADVVEVGCVLARFHEDASRVEPAGAPVLAAERRFERNLQELLSDVEQRGEIETSSESRAVRTRVRDRPCPDVRGARQHAGRPARGTGISAPNTCFWAIAYGSSTASSSTPGCASST